MSPNGIKAACRVFSSTSSARPPKIQIKNINHLQKDPYNAENYPRTPADQNTAASNWGTPADQNTAASN